MTFVLENKGFKPRRCNECGDVIKKDEKRFKTTFWLDNRVQHTYYHMTCWRKDFK